MVDLCLRQILMDKLTLRDYEEWSSVSWTDIRRRLLLNEREVNPTLPDHLYRAALNAQLDERGIDSLPQLLTRGLSDLAEIYIREEHAQMYIEKEHFGQWQELLTFCPPLPLIAAFLWNKYKGIAIPPSCFQNVKHTALLSPDVPELREHKKRSGGLNDLHIHLNGSTETDIVWQDALNDPHAFRNHYKQSLKHVLVREQNEQESVFKDADELSQLLRQARALRYYFTQIIAHHDHKATREPSYPDSDIRIEQYESNLIRGQHPLAPCRDTQHTDTEYECQLYVQILNLLANKQSAEKYPQLAQGFHHYLLILGTMNRFLVQQIRQNGFQQFQKIADNDLRKLSESDYRQRFFQLCGNRLGEPHFKILEGRFAPKKTPKEINRLIGKIRTGWQLFTQDGKIERTHNPELRLVAHFIKKPINKDDSFYHESLRNKLWRQTQALLSLWKDPIWQRCPVCEHSGESLDQSLYLQKLVGIDAAASEFDALPEVFASVYGKIRRTLPDKCHFTFHAGEDFSHIISGLRAIYEAIQFLTLNDKDRIGHAVALGVDYALWRERIGNQIWIKQGEWFDNLLFIYHLYREDHREIPANIATDLNKYFTKVYPRRKLNIDDAVAAWLNRKWNPIFIQSSSFSYLSGKETFDADEWDAFREANISPPVKAIMEAYWIQRGSRSGSNLYDKHILVDLDEGFYGIVDFIQNSLKQIVRDRKIALETLPTSNIRIGIYKNHAEHHLRKWLDEGLDVIIGSDDAGIFATNIYNEYAHAWLSQSIRKKQLECLTANAEHYVFHNVF